jgi:D-sedoheptulose 7-phosphate isomerase
MRHSSEILKSAIAAAEETLQSLIELDAHVAKAADLIEQCLCAGNKMLVCGNGGMPADATSRPNLSCARQRSLRLSGDLSHGRRRTSLPRQRLWFRGNLRARQVVAFGVPGDLLICLTMEIEKFARAGRGKKRNLKTIAFLGRDGGSTIGIADVDLLVANDSTARIQEAHTLLLHVLCEIMEARLPRS